jgi:hypothetical protein
MTLMPPLAEAAVTLTREELYEQVWSEPMWTLAQRFGLSDVGLAKTCRRLKIPVPPRGYWQQRQAGQPVRPTKLPKLSTTAATALTSATFRPVRTRDVAGGPRSATTEADEDLVPITVHEVLTDPHPLVAHTIRALRRVKPSREGLLPRTAAADYLDVRVTLDSVDRAMRILDALLRTMDERGFLISVDIREHRATTRAHVLDEVIPFHLEERIEQITDAPPPPKRPGEWRPPPQKRPVATGALEFHIDAEWRLVEGDARKSWRDGKKQRVEECLPKIVAGFVAAAHALKADRLAREERERSWKEAERRRRYAAWEERQEKRRRGALEEELSAWQLCTDLRAYHDMRRSRGMPSGADKAHWEAWLEWLARYADRIETRLLTRAGPDLEPFDENASYYY